LSCGHHHDTHCEIRRIEEPGLVWEVPADQNRLSPSLLRRADAALIADRQFVTAFGTAAREHLAAIGGFHALTKAVSLSALSVVRLKSTFGHGNPYLRVQSKWKRIGQNVAKDALLLVH